MKLRAFEVKIVNETSKFLFPDVRVLHIASFMALQTPVIQKERYQIDGSNRTEIIFKLSNLQILFVCCNRYKHTAEYYYIYNVLKEENVIDGPHHFPDPIPLREYRTIRHLMALNHEAHTLYILNREGHLVLFDIDTGTLQTLSCAECSDPALPHIPIPIQFNTKILCVNGTLYRLVSDTVNKKSLFYRWNDTNGQYQLISASSRKWPWGIWDRSFAAVPSADLLLSVRIRWERVDDRGVPCIVVQRLYLKTGRRDMVRVQCDVEALDRDLVRSIFNTNSKGGPVLTANSNHALLVGKYHVLILNISDHSQYTADYSNNVELTRFMKMDFDKHSGYELVGTTGSDGLLGAGMCRQSMDRPLPVVLCDLIEMYLSGERLHLIKRDVYTSIGVNHIMKGRIRVANQSETVEIEHEIIDRENDENDDE